jgi:transcriptional regulator with XRE-family HTH domain
MKGRTGPSAPPEGLVAAFRGRLSAKRKGRGMTQASLAERAGASRNAVVMWESGAAFPSVAMLVALADALDVTTDWLLGRDLTLSGVVVIEDDGYSD